MTEKTVFISGYSGVGKSFTGDYLESMCGFYHIDGDMFINSKEPEHTKLRKDLLKAISDYWCNEISAPRELWEPYYEIIVGLVKKAHKTNTNVVVSMLIYRREVRDYFRMHFPRHTYILLNLSEEEILKRRLKRIKLHLENPNSSYIQLWEEFHKLTFTMDNFLKHAQKLIRGLQPIEDDEILSFEIDAGTDEMYNKLHNVLQLPTPQAPEAVILAADIAKINYRRWEK